MSGEEWFSTDLAKGLSRIYNNSHVQAFVDAEAYYADLRKEVEATNRGGLICWIGFEGHGDTPLPATVAPPALKEFPPRKAGDGDRTWFDLLSEASKDRGVALRVLLNLHPKPDMNPSAPKKYRLSNFDLVEKLNTLPTCLAINDSRYLWMNGTHHQKLVLVYNAQGLSAYVGTCDVEIARINNRWCEVQCKIKGDVAAELFEVFHRRWSEHTAVFERAGSLNSYLKSVNDLRLNTPPAGNFVMQTSTTYGNPGRLNPLNIAPFDFQPAHQVLNQPHAVYVHTNNIPLSAALLAANAPTHFGNDFFTQKDPKARPYIVEAARQSRTYSFAKDGHTGIYTALKKAIETTREYIYIEDQYLVDDMKMGSLAALLDLLVDKVKQPQFKKLIVFCTRIDDINDEFQGTGWAHRRNFIQSLVNAASDKVVICQYKSRGELGQSFGQPHEAVFYIHSKTWVFDDLFFVTGSANCNRRGYSHDSELDIGIYDQNKQFVRDLRVRLWQNRLNTQGIRGTPLQPNQLTDFLSAARYWESPRQFGLTITNNREQSLEPKKFPDLDLASYKAQLTGDPSYLVPARAWLDEVKMSKLWDLVVDPDGA